MTKFMEKSFTVGGSGEKGEKRYRKVVTSAGTINFIDAGGEIEDGYTSEDIWEFYRRERNELA